MVYRRTVSAIDIERENEIHDVLVEPPSARRGVPSALEHRTLDIEVARFSERHRGIDDQEVRQQQPGERVIAVPVEWPIDLAVESVVEGKIGVQSHPVGVEIIRLKVEVVLAVIEVTVFEVLVHLIKHLEAHGHVLDFRTADAFYSNWSLAGCERFAHDGKQGAAFQRLAPFKLEDDRENVGAVESVGPL